MNTTTTPPAPAHAPPPLPDGDGNGRDERGAGGHDDHAALHDLPTDLPRPSRLAVTIVGVVAVLLLAAMFVIGYIPHHIDQTQIDNDAQATASAIPIVQLATLKASAPESDIALPANNVMAWQQTALFPRITGYIASWNHDYDIGAHVDGGKVLAVIAAPDVDAQLSQARANLKQGNAAVEKANADVEIARSTYDRYKQWMNTTAGVSQQDLDDRKNALDDAVAVEHQSVANVAALDAAVQQLTVQKGFEKIVAPFTGIVTARNYDVGALMIANNASAKEMFDMQETDKLRVFISVPQTYASTITTGTTKAYLTVRNYPGHEFQGIVARTAGALDPVSRTMVTEVDVDNPDGLLKPAMYGTVRLPLSQAHPSLILPTSALAFDAAGLRVAVVKDNTVHFVDIGVGRDYGTTIEVTKGITATDQVIDNPGLQLAEGAKVQVKDSTQPGQPAPNQRVVQAN